MAADDGVDASAAGVPGKLKIKREGLAKAMRALIQVVKKRTASTNQLFESSGETVTVLFTLGKVPMKKKTRPFIIELPFPMFDETSEVCFFSKSPQKPWKEMLLKKSIPGLNKVIGMDKLGKNYGTLEAKKALCEAFDLFVCDAAIADVLPRSLGRIFYQERHKIPIPVNLTLGGDPDESIKKIIRGTPVRIPAGPCLGVKIGRCGMPEEQLIKNAATVIAGVAKLLHDKHQNYLQNISIQATNAPALPIWRRPATPGGPIDLKKHRRAGDTTSSAASETGSSLGSETEAIDMSELPSDAGETLSTRDSISEQETMDETTQSEMDSEAGDVDAEAAPAKGDMPLMKGLKKRARRRQAATGADTDAALDQEAAAESMPPPSKKAKKAKAAP